MIELLPLPTMAPVPRVRVRVTEIPAGATRITVSCQSRSGVRAVRQAVEAAATDPFSVTDYAVPWNEDVMYRADFSNSVGAPVGVPQYGLTRVTFFGTVVHQPLDPSRRVAVDTMVATARNVQRTRMGEHVSLGGSGAPIWIGQGGSGLSTRLRLRLFSDLDRAAAESMFGSPASPIAPEQVFPPILCLRTSHPLNLPQPFIFLAAETDWEAWDHFAGGESTMLDWSVVETTEPALGLLVSPYSYEDIELQFATYEEIEAASATYEELEERSDLAGVA